MGVETKKMTNSIATAGGEFGERLKSWPERIKSFYNDVRTEMRKVIITVFLFGLFFWLVDLAISKTLDNMLHYLARH